MSHNSAVAAWAVPSCCQTNLNTCAKPACTSSLGFKDVLHGAELCVFAAGMSAALQLYRLAYVSLVLQVDLHQIRYVVTQASDRLASRL